MPAIDTLFDPLVTSLLRSRISEVDPKIPEANEEDEDVTMIDDIVPPPLFATRPTRIPNQGEMELFTQLFRTTSIIRKSSVSSKANGKTNGAHSLKSNGISSIETIVSKPTQRPPSDGVNPHEISTPEPSFAPPPISKGKKRKKVSVEAVVSND